MKIFSRILAITLIINFIGTIMPVYIFAGAPTVTVDETVYVNSDYYGKTTKLRIVKGCSLNGNNQFTDYGSYDNVTNMTDESIPIIDGKAVTWKLNKDSGNFFFECTPKKGNVILPWSIDVSYKLNGIPINAKKLAGASGLVEINVKVIPNQNVSSYLKNNMLLQVSMPVDLDKNISVDAPGAQIQAVGHIKTIMFAALPGEEKTFTMRIGSKCFEMDGIVVTMLSGTMDSLKNIKEIKKDKDILNDSFNANYESTNILLDTIQSMNTALNKMKSGFTKLNNANNTISSSKKGLYNKADKSLMDLSEIVLQTNAIIPHLQEGQLAINDINSDINLMTKTITQTKTELQAYYDSINKTQKNIDELVSSLTDINANKTKRESLFNDTSDIISEMKNNDLSSLKDDLNTMKNNIRNMNSSIATFKSALSTITYSPLPTYDPTDLNGAVIIADLDTLNKQMAGTLQAASPLMNNLTVLANSASSITDILSDTCDTSTDFLKNADNWLDLFESYSKSADKINDTSINLLNELKNTGTISQNMLTYSQESIDNINKLNDTLNKYKASSINTLKDTEKLTRRLSSGLSSTTTFLGSFEDVLKKSDNNLDNGTQQSLLGTIDALQKSLNAIDQTSTFKKTNNTTKKTYDKELNKFENENKILNLDYEAKPVSFTSSKNPSPQSIQVIMRTEEINIDNGKVSKDIDESEHDIGILAKILKIFEKIWLGITGMFTK